LQHRPTGESSHACDLRCARYAYLHIYISARLAAAIERGRPRARTASGPVFAAVASGGDNVPRERRRVVPFIRRHATRPSCVSHDHRRVVGGCICISVRRRTRLRGSLFREIVIPRQEYYKDGISETYFVALFLSGLKTPLIFHERFHPKIPTNS